MAPVTITFRPDISTLSAIGLGVSRPHTCLAVLDSARGMLRRGLEIPGCPCVSVPQDLVVAVDNQANGDVQSEQREQDPDRIRRHDVGVVKASSADLLAPPGRVEADLVERGDVGPLPEQGDPEDACVGGRHEIDRKGRIQEKGRDRGEEAVAHVDVEAVRAAVGVGAVVDGVGGPEIPPKFGGQQVPQRDPGSQEFGAGCAASFLSRPRRFGKSLLIDTLLELFEGNEPLFRGLDIHGHWDWSVKHPVVRLSFDGKYTKPEDLEHDIAEQFGGIEEDAGLDSTLAPQSGSPRFRSLLRHLHQATGQPVVILVDEYDKPILDALDNPELAKANRDYLGGFYGVIKGSTKHVHFVFMTGVSMFSKVSLFSGLNNLDDISLDPQYATVCGYTDADIDTVFAAELPGLDRDDIRAWYNGYHWRGGKKVYNPFDVLLLFKKREFQNHWFETGTPTFLYQLLQERNVNPLELENSAIGAHRLSKLDVGDIDLHALMFQTGYLTIAEEERRGPETFYRLEHPNLEVRKSFSQGLLMRLGEQEAKVSDRGHAWLAQLAANDFEGFAERFQSYVAGLAHHWWEGPAELGQYESHYAAMLYLTLGLGNPACGPDVHSGDQGGGR